MPIKKTEYLIKYNNQVVTWPDLVFESELTPNECKQFLDKFVLELDGDIKYTDSGKIYYQFPTAKSIEATK